MTGNFKELGEKIGALVQEKNAAYGNSFNESGKILEILYPDGVKKEQYSDMLCLIRILDKMFRIAKSPGGDPMGESPYGDIAGYGLLGLDRVSTKNSAPERVKEPVVDPAASTEVEPAKAQEPIEKKFHPEREANWKVWNLNRSFFEEQKNFQGKYVLVENSRIQGPFDTSAEAEAKVKSEHAIIGFVPAPILDEVFAASANNKQIWDDQYQFLRVRPEYAGKYMVVASGLTRIFDTAEAASKAVEISQDPLAISGKIEPVVDMEGDAPWDYYVCRACFGKNKNTGSLFCDKCVEQRNPATIFPFKSDDGVADSGVAFRNGLF